MSEGEWPDNSGRQGSARGLRTRFPVWSWGPQPVEFCTQARVGLNFGQLSSVRWGFTECVLPKLPGVRALKGFPDRGERQVLCPGSAAHRGFQGLRFGRPEEAARGRPWQSREEGHDGPKEQHGRAGEAGVRRV